MTEIITRKEKISYGLGDMASHIGLDNVIIFRGGVTCRIRGHYVSSGENRRCHN